MRFIGVQRILLPDCNHPMSPRQPSVEGPGKPVDVRVRARRLVLALVAGLMVTALQAPSPIRADVTGTKNVVVLRVYFNDYTNTSRYSKTQVQGFLAQLNTLWGTNNSYGTISISSQVSDLYKLPDNRSSYIDDFMDGDLSNGGKYMLVLNDAVANEPSTSGINWSNVDAVMVVMAETNMTQFHRGQGNKCTLKMGPANNAPSKLVGCAIFSENPSDSDLQVGGGGRMKWGMLYRKATLCTRATITTTLS